MSGNHYLLDTHTLIWFQANDPQLSNSVLHIIQENTNTVSFSQISLFEIAIKQKLGKLPIFDTSIQDIYTSAMDSGLLFLNIQNLHINQYRNIPLIDQHRDPFDRLLIATAHIEKATILSNDRNFKLYDDLVKTIW